jgi:hypothetical protein
MHGSEVRSRLGTQVNGPNGVALADPAALAEILCVEEERIVARDNTVAYAKLRLQLPESRLRAHYVTADVKVHEYPDGTLAVFHGPRLLARYDATGGVMRTGLRPSRDLLRRSDLQALWICGQRKRVAHKSHRPTETTEADN